jgi:hypothetical protein
MWLIAETMDRVSLEWWPQTSDAIYARAPSVALHSSSRLSVEQWGLIKKQFENMAIVPVVSSDKT